MTHLLRFAVGALALALPSCASTPEPVEPIARARLAVEQAERGGGTEPQLSAARDKLAAAERHARDEEYVDARRAAEQAEADARLALAKSRLLQAAESAQELDRTVDAMEEEAQP